MLRAMAAFLVLTCLSGMARAQGLDQPLRPTQTLKITPLTPASAETAGPVLGRGGATATLRSPQAERGVLSSFRFGFMGTDHKVNTLGVLVQGQRAEFILRDRDANDPFRAHATWLQSPSYSATQEVSAHASGDVKIDLPAGPAGHVALLQGFQFKRARATDANVRLVAVQVAEDSRSVRVALVDDQGADFRGMDGVQSLGLAALPLGELLALPVFGARLTGTLPEFDERRLRTYTVTVQYVWVPPSLVLGAGLVAGTTRMADAGTLPDSKDKVGLRGFRFAFGNSDHHLRSVGVDLTGNQRQPILFQDNNLDDPVAWSVGFVRLK